MRKYFLQRSTLLGIAIITCALIGIYEDFLSEGNALLLITFSASGLIPENWPMARKMLTLIAPILVHTIKQQSLPSKNQKKTF